MSDFALTQKITNCWPVAKWREFTVLVAISGGSDSVALLRLLHHLQRRQQGPGRLVLVHINHRLRGEASDQDAEFVQQLGDSLALPVIVKTLPTPELLDTARGTGSRMAAIEVHSHRGASLEGHLRQQRYRAFENVAAEWGARFVVTAHTRQDQVETVVFRLLRGTGIDGLSGIPFQRPLNDVVTIVRPLLQANKSELLHFLSRIGQDFREDASNSDEGFTRNRLRHRIMPQLRDCFGNDVDQAILTLSAQAERQQQLLERLAEPILQKRFQVAQGRIRVGPLPLQDQEMELVVLALRMAWKQAGLPRRDMNAERWQQVTRYLMTGETMRQQSLPGKIRLQRVEDCLEIRAE